MGQERSLCALCYAKQYAHDFISAFENHKTAREIWNDLKLKFGETSATILCAFTLKFDSHKMRLYGNIKHHLRQMHPCFVNSKQLKIT